MNALRHQLRMEVKSVRGFALVWLVWLVLHTACLVTGEHWAHHPLKRHVLFQAMQMSSFWLFLMALFFSKAVAFRDPPLDPNAFWRTRPITGRTLVAAKVLVVGMLMVLPMLVIEGGVAVWAGGPGILPAVAADHLVVRWGALVTLIALASLAGTPMRLFGLVLGLLLALGGVTGALSHGTLPARLDYTSTLIASRILVAGVCAWLGSVSVMLLLYQARHSLRAWMLAGITAVLLGTIFLFWPVDFYRHVPDPGTADLQGVEFDVVRGRVDEGREGPGPDRSLKLEVTLAGADPSVMPRMHKARVMGNSSGRVLGWAQIRAGHPGKPSQMHERIAVPGLPDPGAEYPVTLSLRLPGETRGDLVGGVTVETHIDLFEFRRVGELTLESGSILRLPDGELEVLGLAWAPGKLIIEVREKVLQPMFALHGPVTVLPRHGPASLWTLVVPASADGAPARFTRSDRAAYTPPGKNEKSLFGMFRYRRHQLHIPRLGDEPNSVELVDAYQGLRVQVHQRAYLGTVRHTAVWDGMGPSTPQEGVQP